MHTDPVSYTHLYFVIRFEKGKENRNDDFLVGDQVIVKYDGIIYESNPAVIDCLLYTSRCV